MKIHPLYKKCYSPYTEWAIPEDYFLKLPDTYSFDLQKMRDHVNNVISEVGLNTLQLNDGTSIYSKGYKGMGFTHRKDAPDPHHDAFKVFNEKGELESSATCRRRMSYTMKAKDIHKFEKNFTEKTQYYSGVLDESLKNFKSSITKVRITELAPGESVHPHFDYPYYENIRVHAVLETNDDVEWWVEDQKFNIPSDGNFYWFDTGRFHHIINNGKTPRRVLSVHLSVYKDMDNNVRFNSSKSIIELIKQGEV